MVIFNDPKSRHTEGQSSDVWQKEYAYIVYGSRWDDIKHAFSEGESKEQPSQMYCFL
jgi:hypothetical protein